MKKIVLSVMVVALGYGTTLFGQEMQKPPRPDHRDKLQEELQLTTEQQAQMKSLREDAKLKSEQIFKDESLSKEQKIAQVKAQRETQKAELSKILSAEQQAKLKELKEKRKLDRAAMRPEGRPAPHRFHKHDGGGERGARYVKKPHVQIEAFVPKTVEEIAGDLTVKMTEQLALTKKQVKKAEVVNLEFVKAKQALKQQGKEAVKANLPSLKEKQNAALQKIFTNDQFLKYVSNK